MIDFFRRLAVIDFLRRLAKPNANAAITTKDLDSLKRRAYDAERNAAELTSNLESIKRALDACDADRIKRLADADDQIAMLKAANTNLNTNIACYRADDARLRAKIADVISTLQS